MEGGQATHGIRAKRVEHGDKHRAAIDDVMEAGVEGGDACDVKEKGLRDALGANGSVACDERQHGGGVDLEEGGVGAIIGDSSQPRLRPGRGEGAGGDLILLFDSAQGRAIK